MSCQAGPARGNKGSHFRPRRISSDPCVERAGHDVAAACGGTGSEFPRLFYSFFPPLSSPAKGRNLPPDPPPLTSSLLPSLTPPPPSLPPSCSCLCSVLGHHMLEDRAPLCGNTAGIKTSLIWTLPGMKRIDLLCLSRVKQDLNPNDTLSAAYIWTFQTPRNRQQWVNVISSHAETERKTWMDVPYKKLTGSERNGLFFSVGTLHQLQKYTPTVLHDNKYKVISSPLIGWSVKTHSIHALSYIFFFTNIHSMLC